MQSDVEMILQAVEGVKKRVPRKYVKDCERNHIFAEDLWRALGSQGLLGLGVPEELGGSGGGLTGIIALMEALNGAGLNIPMLVVTGLVRSTLLKYGTEAQKQKYVAPTVSGEMKLCFGCTEPNAGTNMFKVETVAREVPGGGYRLSGQKVYITGFDVSDYCLVVARTVSYKEVTDRREGLSLFMLDTRAAGITKTPIDIEAHVSDRQFALFFDDVEIPADCLVGEAGQGFKYVFSSLNSERLICAAMAIGTGEYVLGKAVDYAKVRAPFDRPIGSYQSMQHPLALAKVHLVVARDMTYKACALYDANQDCGVESNMAKLLASDAGFESVNVAIQAFGGAAMVSDTDILGFFAALRLYQIAPINNQMVLNYIAERVLGLPKSY